MNSQAKARLRRQFEQALCDEETATVWLADAERDLAAADPAYEPARVRMLLAQVEDFRRHLAEAGDKVDELRAQVRAANLPPREPPHPDGAAAAIVERDKKPTQWNQGGLIGDRDKEWEMPVVSRRAGK